MPILTAKVVNLNPCASELLPAYYLRLKNDAKARSSFGETALTKRSLGWDRHHFIQPTAQPIAISVQPAIFQLH